jgi:F-type H+-transporting ATPase subunit gamma
MLENLVMLLFQMLSRVDVAKSLIYR